MSRIIPGHLNIQPRNSFDPLQPIPQGWIKLPIDHLVAGTEVVCAGTTGIVIDVTQTFAKVQCENNIVTMDAGNLEILPTK